MRLFGFSINAKKEPRWVTREEFADLLESLSGFENRFESIEKSLHAARTRIYQKEKKEAESSEAEALLGLEPGNEGPQDEYSQMLQRFKEGL